MNSKKRKVIDENREFNDRWEKDYFFTIQNSKLTCLICRETVAVFKEYNVKRHHETKHIEYANHSTEVKGFKLAALKSHQKAQQTMFSSFLQHPSAIVKASYSVAMLIAKKMKPFSDGELVKDCLEAVIKDVLPDKSKLFSSISLSRQTICRRIEDISAEIVITLQGKIKHFKAYSLAFDESTDISDTSQLVVFIRGVNDSFEVTEEMLNLLHLKDTTRGEDVFQAIDKCLVKNGLKFDALAGLATDGAPAMVGKNKGAIKLLLDNLNCRGIKTNDIFVIHCFIHQHNLCARALSMNHVMNVVIKIVNYIRSHALQHRQFKEFISELSSEYGDIIYFTNVRWLSRGNCLKRFFHLRKEIDIFMNEKQESVPELSDDNWLLDLCFLVDITEKLNQLNKDMQGQDNIIIDACNFIKAFNKKLLLFEHQLRNNNAQHFPLLNNFPKNQPKNFTKYANEIKKLIAAFDSRFSELVKYDKMFEIFSCPFQVDVNSVPENLQMELIELQCNNEMKQIFASISKIHFYNTYITERFFNLRYFAQRVVSAFGSTYVCETFFSKMKFTKSSSRASLIDDNFENQLRCATSNINIDLEKLSGKKDKQISH